MYVKKNIVYVLRYDFGNGEPIKPRYLIVIDNDNESSLVLSVVTSQNHIPDYLIKHGCILEPENRIHCHVFLKNEVIGEAGFKFPLDSFIYVNSSGIFDANSQLLQQKYSNISEVKDCLTNEEFSNLIYCIYKSAYIPRGIKRKIEATLHDICE
ncbi:MAG: hypothetical protein WC044_01525 [Crocinitomicaceae bacterium]